MINKGIPKAGVIFTALRYGALFVIKTKPALAILTTVTEVFSRVAPFATAYISAAIITNLPQVVGSANKSAALNKIVILLVIMFVIREGQRIFKELTSQYTSLAEYQLDLESRASVKQKFASLPLEDYETKEVHDNYELAEEFAGNTSSIFTKTTLQLFGIALSLVLATAAFIHFSLLLAVFIAASFIPIVLLEIRTNRKQEIAWRSGSANRRKGYAYEDLFRPEAITETRLLGLVGLAINKWKHYDQLTRKTSQKIDREVQKYRNISTVLIGIIETCVLVWIVFEISHGRQAIGQFVFIQSLLIQYIGAFSSFAYTVSSFDRDFRGAAEYLDFSKKIIAKVNTIAMTSNKPAVHFKDVSFGYPGSKTLAINNLNLSIPFGQHIAIVGENGAGKTTLIKLLLGLYKPSSGSIYIDDVLLEDIDKEQWHKHVGVLLQDFQPYSLFTIAQSIWFGDISKPLDDSNLYKATDAAKATGFIKKLPEGLHTYMNKWFDEENGTQLSGGQQQRLAIARTLFRNPAILILDEPTSAIDSKAEYEIFNELTESRHGKTTVYISHRFSTVRRADFILVLSDGKVIEQGNHTHLMSQNGVYKDLFNKQAEAYKD